MILWMLTRRVYPPQNQENTGSDFGRPGTTNPMGIAFPRSSARLIHVLDAVVVLWVVAWVVLAVLVGREVRNLRELSDTVVLAGVAVEDTGELVETLERVPFFGGQVGDVASRVREAGESAQVSGRESRESTEDLSVLLALSIGLIPTLPLLGLYAPLRLAWTQDARAVRRALAADPNDLGLRQFLARRAVANLHYYELLAVSRDPYADLDAGRYDALADRELERLGLRRASARKS
jgi:hypothetical protein